MPSDIYELLSFYYLLINALKMRSKLKYSSGPFIGLKKYFLQFPRYFQNKISLWFFSGDFFVCCACQR